MSKQPANYKIRRGLVSGSTRYADTEYVDPSSGGHYRVPDWEKMCNNYLNKQCCDNYDCRKCEIMCEPGREKIKRMNEGRWF